MTHRPPDLIAGSRRSGMAPKSHRFMTGHRAVQDLPTQQSPRPAPRPAEGRVLWRRPGDRAMEKASCREGNLNGLSPGGEGAVPAVARRAQSPRRGDLFLQPERRPNEGSDPFSPDVCPRCGHRVVEIPLGAVPGTSRRECPGCPRFLGFIPTNPTKALEWAALPPNQEGSPRGPVAGGAVRDESGPGKVGLVIGKRLAGRAAGRSTRPGPPAWATVIGADGPPPLQREGVSFESRCLRGATLPHPGASRGGRWIFPCSPNMYRRAGPATRARQCCRAPSPPGSPGSRPPGGGDDLARKATRQGQAPQSPRRGRTGEAPRRGRDGPAQDHHRVGRPRRTVGAAEPPTRA